MKRLITFLCAMMLLMSVGIVSLAQDDMTVIDVDRTVGTIFGEHDEYLLFTPQARNDVYLVDDQGRIVNRWEISGVGRDAWLLDNGNLLVSTTRFEDPQDPFAEEMGFIGIDGRFEEYTWDGELVWSYEPNIPNARVHHGVTPMPNGNILFIAWEYKTNEEAIQAGRNPELLGEGLWNDLFLEYNPELDEIVWQWSAWDHVIQDFDPTKDNYGVVADNPQKININFYDPESQRIEDWIHANTMDYNPVLDQIVISAREYNEFWIVDHSKSTEEVSGEAGDLLYRWGNPQTYDRGTAADRHLYFQHDVQWVDEGLRGAGNIIVYSNDNRFTSLNEAQSSFNFSTIVEITPPLNDDGTYAIEDSEAYAPAEPTWYYDGFPNNFFYSRRISGTQRLPNGNTLVNKGQQIQIFEVDQNHDVVWLYEPPLAGNRLTPQGSPLTSGVFRTRRYAPNHPALEGRDLTPSLTLEDLAGSSQDFVGAITTSTTFSALMTEDITERYYGFQANRGDSLQIRARGMDTSGALSLSINDPDTQEVLVQAEANADGETLLAYNIPEEDNYVLVLTVDGEEDTLGRYGVELLTGAAIAAGGVDVFEGVDDDIPRLNLGATIDDEITGDNPDSVYVFYGEEGQTFSLTMTPVSGDLIPAMNLQNTSRQILEEAESETQEEISIEDYVLPYTGTYFVYVSRNINLEERNTVGEFQVTLTDSGEMQ